MINLAAKQEDIYSKCGLVSKPLSHKAKRSLQTCTLKKDKN